MISEIIEKWIKGILIDGITGNLSGLFDNVNAKVGEIASDVGSTPQAWNSGIFNMLRSLSETVVLPIAAAILALVMCHELIQMITEKNNMHDFDTSMFFRWIFKSTFAILIVSNTWNIVMGMPYIMPKTSSKKFRQKIRDIKVWLYANRDQSLKKLMGMLNLKLVGHYRYYGISFNGRMISNYKQQVRELLFKVLNRRSDRKSYTREGFIEMLKYYPLAMPKIYVSLF